MEKKFTVTRINEDSFILEVEESHSKRWFDETSKLWITDQRVYTSSCTLPIGRKVRICTKPRLRIVPMGDMFIDELEEYLMIHGRRCGGIPKRAYNCLTYYSVRTVVQLFTMSEGEVSVIRNLGKKTLEALKDFGQSVGLHFGMTEDEIIEVLNRL